MLLPRLQPGTSREHFPPIGAGLPRRCDRIVYVLRIGDGARLKIGSADPRAIHDRLRSLSGEHKETLTILALLPGSYQHETALVTHFAALAIEGKREYFNDDGTIAAWVAKLPATNRCHIVHAYLGAAGKGPKARRNVPSFPRGEYTFAGRV